MANTFKVVSHDVMPASSGTPEDLYTCPAPPQLSWDGACKRAHQSSHGQRKVVSTSGGGRTATNTTTFLLKDAPLPVGSSLEFFQATRWSSKQQQDSD